MFCLCCSFTIFAFLASATTSEHADLAETLKDLPALDLGVNDVVKRMSIVFDKIDTNADGIAEYKELETFVKHVVDRGYELMAEEEHRSADLDTDGFISKEELSTKMLGHQADPSNADFEGRFQLADKNQDGKLSESESSVFFNPNHFGEMIDKDIETIISLYDTDKDSKISLEEFMKTDIEEKPNAEEEEALKSDFKSFDYNDDSFVDTDELRKFMTEQAEGETENTMTALQGLGDRQGLSREVFISNLADIVPSALTDKGRLLMSGEEYKIDIVFPPAEEKKVELEDEHTEL